MCNARVQAPFYDYPGRSRARAEAQWDEYLLVRGELGPGWSTPPTSRRRRTCPCGMTFLTRRHAPSRPQHRQGLLAPAYPTRICAPLTAAPHWGRSSRIRRAVRRATVAHTPQPRARSLERRLLLGRRRCTRMGGGRSKEFSCELDPRRSLEHPADELERDRDVAAAAPIRQQRVDRGSTDFLEQFKGRRHFVTLGSCCATDRHVE